MILQRAIVLAVVAASVTACVAESVESGEDAATTDEALAEGDDATAAGDRCDYLDGQHRLDINVIGPLTHPHDGHRFCNIYVAASTYAPLDTSNCRRTYFARVRRLSDNEVTASDADDGVGTGNADGALAVEEKIDVPVGNQVCRLSEHWDSINTQRTRRSRCGVCED